jgi:hypothetical protein
MALKEDYKDAVFAGLRKYKMMENGDGTISPVDMTEYEAAGDKFGAKDVNAITKKVNATGEIIADDNDGFKPDQKYVIGDIVIYDNKTWRFKVDHEPGEWDESHVEKTRILVEIAEQNKNFEALNEKIQNQIGENTKLEFGTVSNSGNTRTITLKSNYAEMLYFSTTLTITASAFLREITFTPPNIVKYKFLAPDNTSALTSVLPQTYMFAGK